MIATPAPRIECRNLGASLSQILQVALGKLVAANLIVQEVDPNALASLTNQSILQLAAQLIVFDDEELNQYVVLRRLANSITCCDASIVVHRAQICESDTFVLVRRAPPVSRMPG